MNLVDSITLETFERGLVYFLRRGIRFEATPLESIPLDPKQPTDARYSENLRLHLGGHPLSASDQNWIKKHKSEIVSWLHGEKASVLSLSQERLWYLDQLGFGFQYHIPALADISGALDVDALHQALQAIVDRHESLRTRFIDIDGFPVQRIAKSQTLDFSIEDIVVEEVECLQDKQKDRLQRFFNKPFDLKHDPLIRALLIQQRENNYRLALSMHHIVSDGWSMQVLLRELCQHYTAARRDPSNAHSSMSLQYSGYSAWQQSLTINCDQMNANTGSSGQHGQQFQKDKLAFWQDKLAAYRDLKLPTDFRRPNRPSGRGDVHRLTLTTSLWQRIEQCSREFRTTPLCIFAASVYWLLSRYAGHMDFCFGLPVANRSQPELEAMIGFFVNTLIIKPDIDSDALHNDTYCTEDFLLAMRQALLDAQEYQSLPVETILDELQPERQLNVNPVFQVLINYARIPASHLQLGEAKLSPSFDFDVNSAKFDLSFTLNEFVDGEKIIFIEYATDLFKAQTIQRMAGQLETVMQEIIAKVKQPLNNVHLVNGCEASALLTLSHNKEPVPFETKKAVQKTLHQCLVDSAATYPDHTALRMGERSLSYAKLNALSTQFAHYLQHYYLPSPCDQTAPAQRQPVVAIACHRSFDLVIAILGALKAGATFLPLDPHEPVERLSYKIKQAKAMVLVSQSTWLERLQTIEITRETGCHCVYFDDIHRELSEFPKQIPTVGKANDLAYISFTSGSSGQPKGVMVEHRHVIHHNFTAMALYNLVETDRVLQFSNLSFDIFIEELFPTLLSGATLVLLDETQRHDVQYVQSVVETAKVSVMNVPTAYWHFLANQPFDAPHLRLVIIGGEAAHAQAWQQWRQRHPQVSVMNTYGPTETTVIATAFRLDADFPPDREIPMGKPIPGVTTYLLDDQLQPVPIGVPGMLYIGGKGVARGYLGNASLTQARFIPDPFSLNDNQNTDTAAKETSPPRMFATGDRACWLDDGNLQFLGRTDTQIKIRGYRVEPEEIETVLRDHPAIDDAIVLPIEHRPSLPIKPPLPTDRCTITDKLSLTNECVPPEKRLIAFVRSATLSEIAGINDDIRPYIKQRLPDYLQPRLILPLDAFPTTVNGKIDRNALKALGEKYVKQHSAIGDSGIATQSISSVDISNIDFTQERHEVVSTLMRLWQQLLGLDTIALDDDFYQIGGHSLLSVQLVSTINTVFKLSDKQRIRIADIIQYSTLNALAELIKERSGARMLEERLSNQDVTPPDCSPHLHRMKSADISLILPGLPGFSDAYQELAECIDDGSEVIGFTLCGYNDGEQPLTSINAMAEYYLSQLSLSQLSLSQRQHFRSQKGTAQTRLHIYAHSYGGTIALALLQQLHQRKDLSYEIGSVTLIDSSLHRPVDTIDRDSLLLFCKTLLKKDTLPPTLASSIDAILNQTTHEQRPSAIRALLNQHGVKLQASLFEKLWQVVEASISARVTLPSQPLPFEMRLIVAEHSREWLDVDAWQPYFQKVLVEYSPGDHQSLVRLPDCRSWLRANNR